MSFAPAELAALCLLVSLKPHARAEAFNADHLGTYGARNEYIARLADKGLVKVNKAGAVSVDNTAARKVLAAHVRPAGYRLPLCNAHHYFAASVERPLPHVSESELPAKLTELEAMKSAALEPVCRAIRAYLASKVV